MGLPSSWSFVKSWPSGKCLGTLSLHLLLWLLPDLLFYPLAQYLLRKGECCILHQDNENPNSITKFGATHKLKHSAMQSLHLQNGDNNNCKHALNA